MGTKLSDISLDSENIYIKKEQMIQKEHFHCQLHKLIIHVLNGDLARLGFYLIMHHVVNLYRTKVRRMFSW